MLEQTILIYRRAVVARRLIKFDFRSFLLNWEVNEMNSLMAMRGNKRNSLLASNFDDDFYAFVSTTI